MCLWVITWPLKGQTIVYLGTIIQVVLLHGQSGAGLLWLKHLEVAQMELVLRRMPQPATIS